MQNVSRETYSREEASRFLDCLGSCPPVQSWLSAWGEPGRPRAPLTHIHASLLPFFLSILQRAEDVPILCFLPHNRLARDSYERLLILHPDEVGVMACPGGEAPDQDPGLDPHLPALTQTVNLFLSTRLSFLLASPKSLMETHLTAPHSHTSYLSLRIGRPSPLASLKATLASWGYERSDSVFIPGSFAVRGGIVDVFPFDLRLPIRIELTGDTVESIRSFDPVSQRAVPHPEQEIVSLHAPFYPGPPHNEGRPLRSLLPPATVSLVLQEAGPSHIYNLYPLTPESSRPPQAVHLNCMTHAPFRGNQKLLRETVTQLNKKQEVRAFVFFDPPFGEKVRSDPILQTFVPICFPFSGAFSSSSLNLFCASLHHIYELPRRPPMTRGPAPHPTEDAATLKDLEGFPWGGHVVHEDFGIGLYRGLTRINTKSGPHECVSIEFQGGDLVHVPLERLNRVHNYVGSSRKSPTLSSLRSARWEQAKRQTRRSAERVVDDFIRLYSERHAARGTSFSADASLHQALRASFPYEETRHQLKAYEEIRKDMESSKPMDRLLCGDVGFGKTEVAIRAAFKAVYDQKQVAVLTPTTILASQHFVTFKARLNDLGVNVALLSRFTTPVRQRQVIHELKERRVDVIVGTHRLLSRDIRIPELGFLIIDEEHRFGARHKEALKKLRTSVDVLSMSATPIPRTLQFSLLGIRDISTITIPPRERLPIITRVLPFDDECIRNGITFEVERGGQVFFVHNDVRTINPVAGRLRLLLPGLRVGVAHGQLPGRKLEEVMLAFLNKDIDVLVCTTIVEAGIDLPNVNTIFIDSAHHFGLSQIYQMRGRVGRSTRQAYCYLFCPASKKLTHQAHDRLKAIEYFSALGSGYAIALKDLELRGAGNLFGVEQSGHISSVGFHLYCKIVEEAARRRLNHGPAKIETSPVRMTFEGHATIPPDYIPNVADRLYVYRRIARARHRKDIDDIKGEMGDRFGSLPQEVIHLLGVASIQVSARGSGLTQLTISSHELRGSFDPGVGVRFLRKFTRVLQDTLSARDLSFRLSTPATGGPGFSVTTGSAQEAFQAAQYLFESFPSSPNFTRQDSNSDTTT